MTATDTEILHLTERLSALLCGRGINHVSIFPHGSVCIASTDDPRTIYSRDGIIAALREMDARTNEARILETLY